MYPILFHPNDNFFLPLVKQEQKSWRLSWFLMFSCYCPSIHPAILVPLPSKSPQLQQLLMTYLLLYFFGPTVSPCLHHCHVFLSKILAYGRQAFHVTVARVMPSKWGTKCWHALGNLACLRSFFNPCELTVVLWCSQVSYVFQSYRQQIIMTMVFSVQITVIRPFCDYMSSVLGREASSGLDL